MKKTILIITMLLSFKVYSNGKTTGYIESCNNSYTTFKITVQGSKVKTKGLVTDKLEGQLLWNKHYKEPYYYDSTPNYKFTNTSGDTTYLIVNDPYTNSLSIIRSNNRQGLIKNIHQIKEINCDTKVWLK